MYGILEDRFLTLGVGDEVTRDVALVEAHALGELELQAEGVGLLDGDDTLVADLVHGLGDQLADLGVAGRDGGGGSDLLLGLDLLGRLQQRLGDLLDGLLDTALEAERVGAGRNVAQTLAHERLGQHGGGGGAVAGDVVSLLGDFLDQLCADLLVRVLQLDLLGDGHTIVGDRGGAPLLLEDDVATSGPSVTFTASARALSPRSRPRRASSSYAIVLAIAKCSSGLGAARLLVGLSARDGRLGCAPGGPGLTVPT